MFKEWRRNAYAVLLFVISAKAHVYTEMDQRQLRLNQSHRKQQHGGKHEQTEIFYLGAYVNKYNYTRKIKKNLIF